MKKLKQKVLTDKISTEDYAKIEGIYNQYAPKLFGFIGLYTETKQQAEEYMSKVFEQIARDVKYFDVNTEKKLLSTVLSICKPLFKSRKSKIYSTGI